MNTYQFISVFIWQLTVAGFIYLFRTELAALFSRIRSAEIFGQKILTNNVNEVTSKTSSMDAHLLPILYSQALSVSEDFRPQNDPTAFYFFSHDLMLTYAAVLTGARKRIAELTIRSAEVHFLTLGFASTPVYARFQEVMNRIKETGQKDWDRELREELANDIWAISRFVGNVIAVRTPRV